MLAIAAALGCGHAAPTPGPGPGSTHGDGGAGDAPRALDDDLPALAARSLKQYQELAGMLGGPAIPCSDATTKVNAVATKYADVIAANDRVAHAGHDKIKRLKAALEPLDADFTTAVTTIKDSATLRACSDDAGFAKAFDRLSGERS